MRPPRLDDFAPPGSEEGRAVASEASSSFVAPRVRGRTVREGVTELRGSSHAVRKAGPDFAQDSSSSAGPWRRVTAARRGRTEPRAVSLGGSPRRSGATDPVRPPGELFRFRGRRSGHEGPPAGSHLPKPPRTGPLDSLRKRDPSTVHPASNLRGGLSPAGTAPRCARRERRSARRQGCSGGSQDWDRVGRVGGWSRGDDPPSDSRGQSVPRLPASRPAEGLPLPSTGAPLRYRGDE